MCRELERCDDRLRQLWNNFISMAGRSKVRREMAVIHATAGIILANSWHKRRKQ